MAAPKATSGWVALSGAVTGNTANTDWEDAFAALHEIEAHWIVPLSDNAAIWDLAAAHRDFMSSNKRERRAFVGGGTGVDDASQAIADALAINSDRVGYVLARHLRPGIQLRTRAAAASQGLHGRRMWPPDRPPSIPARRCSRKAISVAGAEVLLREPTDTDALLEAGVIPPVQTERGVIVSQAVSAWM
ncbi:MAG: hypothetical protein MZV65_31650 [Chromatiales bacterium]|nr:hypothetical protein [Chromatiales bacterium]